MKTPVFCGSAVAIVTPFDENGKVNINKFYELIDMQAAAGTAAIVVCGTTGEKSTLKDDEHVDLIRKCMAYVNGRMKVVAGTGSNDTEYSLHLCQEAEDVGVDGLLMVTPYYNKTTQYGLIKHYTYVADRVNTPIILYNVPSRTGMTITTDTLKTLSQHPMINGIKDAAANISNTAATIAACGDDLYVWSGNDDEIVAQMALGAKGVISVWANIDPKAVADVCAACLKGDFKTAAKLQLDAYKLIKALFIETNPMPVKTAMNMMGMAVGEARPPLCEMLPANEAILRAELVKAGLLK